MISVSHLIAWEFRKLKEVYLSFFPSKFKEMAWRAFLGSESDEFDSDYRSYFINLIDSLKNEIERLKKKRFYVL